MHLKLTPARLRAAYNFLDLCPPFDGWNLPDAEDVTFVVSRTHHYGDFVLEGRNHRIAVSQRKNVTIATLLATMAHEMIHVHQALQGLEIKDNAFFSLQADKVCKELNFDRGTF